MKRNPGFFNKIQRKRKQKQTFEEACDQRKPPGLRPRQTVVVDNEGRYFLVSENTPEHQREAGYREVLVFPCDSAGEPYSWSEVGGRKNVDFSTFLADLLEGRETLDEELVELAAAKRNPGGAKQRARGTRKVSPQKHHTRSWQQQHERYMKSAAASRREAARTPPRFMRHDALVVEADEHRFAAKQIRERSRPYAFQLRSESGNSASFQSHAEALKWAESNLKKGEFFTVSKDSDHFHEHYVKE